MDYDKAFEKLENNIKFCPICGNAVVIKIEPVVSPYLRGFTKKVKTCPNGHGTLDSGGGDGRGLVIELEPPDSFYEDCV